MPIIDAILAFAITMLVVSTIVTKLLDLYNGVMKIRNEHLKKLLQAYLSAEVYPTVQRELVRIGARIDNEAAGAISSAASGLGSQHFFDEDEMKKLVSVSREELMERLKRSELGLHLLSTLKDDANTVFEQLGQRFDVFGEKFSAAFRASSRWRATIIATLLALVLNIDSFYIANTYLNNNSIREAALANLQTSLQAVNPDNIQDAQAKPREGQQAQASDQVAIDQVTQDINDIQTRLDEVKAGIGQMQSMGFPVGWTLFPHALFFEKFKPSPVNEANKQVLSEAQKRNNRWNWGFWILGVISTGLLAGLGSTFWYDVVTGVSRIAQKKRSADTR